MDGQWMVRVFGFPETPTNRVQFAGDEKFVYRLRISTGPVVHYALPMAATTGQPNQLQLVGWNIPTELSQVSLTPQLGIDEWRLGVATDGFGGSVRIPVVEGPTLVESESASKSDVTPITLPVSMTGRIDEPGDRDVFELNAEKGRKLDLRVESRELGYPLDPVLELFDANDNSLAKVDDAAGGRDAQLTHDVAEDAKLRVVVSDIHRSGGPDFVYRLSVIYAQPTVRLIADAHQYIVKSGEKTDVTISVERANGFDKLITFSVDGLPEGVTAEAVPSKAGEDSAAKVVLSLVAATDVGPVSLPIQLKGQVESGDSKPVRFAAPSDPAAMADVWLTVTAATE